MASAVSTKVGLPGNDAQRDTVLFQRLLARLSATSVHVAKAHVPDNKPNVFIHATPPFFS